jgi:hypothetical protein
MLSVIQYIEKYGSEKVKNKLFSLNDAYLIKVLNVKGDVIQFNWYAAFKYDNDDAYYANNEYIYYKNKKYIYMQTLNTAEVNENYIIDEKEAEVQDKEKVMLYMTLEIKELLTQMGFFEELNKLGVVVE